MISLVWDEGFKRSYRKKVKRNEELKRRFWAKIELFTSNPFSPQLRTHKLSGKLKDQWAFSVDDDCRIVFEFINENNVLLIDIGSHDEVY